jgi:hypothetical protein
MSVCTLHKYKFAHILVQSIAYLVDLEQQLPLNCVEALLHVGVLAAHALGAAVVLCVEAAHEHGNVLPHLRQRRLRRHARLWTEPNTQRGKRSGDDKRARERGLPHSNDGVHLRQRRLCRHARLWTESRKRSGDGKRVREERHTVCQHYSLRRHASLFEQDDNSGSKGG